MIEIAYKRKIKRGETSAFIRDFYTRTFAHFHRRRRVLETVSLHPDRTDNLLIERLNVVHA